MKLHLKRPCLIIADLERSLTLYRDVLGFRVDYISEEASSESYLYTAFGFPPHAKLKFAALSTDCEARSLALAEAKNIDLPHPSLPHRAATVIRVPEVPPIIEKVAQLGLKIVRANSFTAPPNLCFTEQGFCDWDGHLIILYDVRQQEVL